METVETKLSLEDRVSKKMGLAKWMIELYFQIHEAVTNDKRYANLSNYLQSSMITTMFIATKEALDKNRDVRETAEQLVDISKSKTKTKKSA